LTKSNKFAIINNMEDKKTLSAMQAISERIKYLNEESKGSRSKAVLFLGAAALSGVSGYMGAVDGESTQAIFGAAGAGASAGIFLHHNIEARQSATEAAVLSGLQAYEQEHQAGAEEQSPPPQPE
jgi:hypothetical protein